MFNLFRLCRKDEISFDIVAETGNIVSKNRQQCRSNIVEATFDFVAFDNVGSTLLLVWTGLYTAAVFRLLSKMFVSEIPQNSV